MFRTFRAAAAGVLLCAVTLTVGPMGVMAQTTKPSADPNDITDVTVFLRRGSSVPGANIRISPNSASSCGFFGSGGDSEFTRGYLESMGSDPDSDPNDVNDNNDSRSFSISAPYGDASRDTSRLPLNGAVGGNSGGGIGGGSTGGCTQADRNFAAGRAHIARNDKTLSQAYALFDQKKYPEALAMFKKSYSKIGYADAALMIGKMYLYGVGTARDTPQAIVWLRKVADERFTPRKPRFDPKRPDRMDAPTESSILLAKIYMVGHDVPKDPGNALKWYQKAAERGYIPASKTVGDFYYFGYGATRSYPKAAGYYKTAAEYGYSPAQYAYAQMLEAGEGMAANPKTALAWYGETAKANHPGGLYAVAMAYDAGKNIPADQSKALYFYKEAAIRGNPDAQNAVGTYFYTGSGTLPRDHPIARKWFEVSARNGNADAMFNLAVMLMKGEGGDIDRVKAWAWFTLAGKLGHPDAATALKNIEGQMSPTEKAEAQALLNPKT